MNVTRVRDTTGDHIEPPLDESWDDLTKLRWHAAVVAHETGLSITVEDGARRTQDGTPIRGWYGLSVGPIGSAAFTFDGAWTYLNGVSAGAVAAVRRHGPPPLWSQSATAPGDPGR